MSEINDRELPQAQVTPAADESVVSRRDAIKTFGLASFAAAFDLSLPQLERATRAVAALGEPDSQPSPYKPRFFTAKEWRLVRMLSDYVIPRDARSGSATDAKVPEFMDFLLADKDASLTSQNNMRGGLAWMDNESRHRFGKDFVAAADAQRRQILDDIAFPRNAKPELSHGVAFFTRFRDMTASGFFSSAMGWKDVQYMGNTFNPNWNGCPQPALDKLGVTYDVMNSRVPTGK
jgi:gluconate 2-dehydrogenase gamma chain